MTDNVLARYYNGRNVLSQGPPASGYDKLADLVSSATGFHRQGTTTNALARGLDLATLGMLTGAYDGGREIADTGRPGALAMALMPGAKVGGVAAKGLSLPMNVGRHEIDQAGSRLTYKVGDDGRVALDSIYSTADARGKGNARSLVQSLVDAADAEKRAMSLAIVPGAPGVDPARLRGWYESLGFSGPDYNMRRQAQP